MSKKYIRDSNLAPSPHIGMIVLYLMFIKMFNLPTWTYGVLGTFAVIFIASFIYRVVTEESVDVVER